MIRTFGSRRPMNRKRGGRRRKRTCGRRGRKKRKEKEKGQKEEEEGRELSMADVDIRIAGEERKKQ